MIDVVTDVADFHRKYGLEYAGQPRALLGELGEFRKKFLEEELREYKKDMYRASYYVGLWEAQRGVDKAPPFLVASHLEGMLDALVDLVYVAVGTAHLHGFDFAEAWRRVHSANMMKVRAERASDSKRGTTFDVVKPPGWVAPSHLDLVTNHAHR